MSYSTDLVKQQDDSLGTQLRKNILVADVAVFSLASVKIFVLPQYWGMTASATLNQHACNNSTVDELLPVFVPSPMTQALMGTQAVISVDEYFNWSYKALRYL